MCVSDLNFKPGIVQKPVKQFNVNLLKAFCVHPYSRSNVAQQGSAILLGFPENLNGLFDFRQKLKQLNLHF